MGFYFKWWVVLLSCDPAPGEPMVVRAVQCRFWWQRVSEGEGTWGSQLCRAREAAWILFTWLFFGKEQQWYNFFPCLRAVLFNRSTLQEFLKHAIPGHLMRGTDLCRSRSSDKNMTTANTTIAIWCEWIKVIPIYIFFFVWLAKKCIFWCTVEF